MASLSVSLDPRAMDTEVYCYDNPRVTDGGPASKNCVSSVIPPYPVLCSSSLSCTFLSPAYLDSAFLFKWHQHRAVKDHPSTHLPEICPLQRLYAESVHSFISPKKAGRECKQGTGFLPVFRAGSDMDILCCKICALKQNPM